MAKGVNSLMGRRNSSVVLCLTLILLHFSCCARALILSPDDDDWIITIAGLEKDTRGGAGRPEENNGGLVKMTDHWNLYTDKDHSIINGVAGDQLIFFDPAFQTLLFSWFDNQESNRTDFDTTSYWVILETAVIFIVLLMTPVNDR